MTANRYDLLGIKISVTDLQSATDQILEWVQKKQKTYICVAPVSTVVDCQRSGEYKNIVNGADMVTPDGVPLVWLGRLKGYKQIQRTCGPDLMNEVCDKGRKNNVRHYFYGGNDVTKDLLLAKVRQKFSDINIVGAEAPPFLKVGEIEAEEVLQRINSIKPDILWIGLGSPKQDYWMFNHRAKLEVPVMIGVGAAFDFLAGTKKRAPVWLQRLGLEWLFRLTVEPKRLWKRYLVGNISFLWWVIGDFIKVFLKRNKKNETKN